MHPCIHSLAALERLFCLCLCFPGESAHFHDFYQPPEHCCQQHPQNGPLNWPSKLHFLYGVGVCVFTKTGTLLLVSHTIGHPPTRTPVTPPNAPTQNSRVGPFKISSALQEHLAGTNCECRQNAQLGRLTKFFWDYLSPTPALNLAHIFSSMLPPSSKGPSLFPLPVNSMCSKLDLFRSL